MPAPPGLGEDFRGEAVPGGVRRAGEVEQTEGLVARRRRQKSRRHARDGIGEVRGEGRRAVLVGDDADLLPLLREPQHRLDEVRAIRAADPGGADHRAARIGGEHGPLPRFLGRAIDAERAGRIGLGIRAALEPVEDIVGGEMHEGRAARSRRGGEPAGAGRVHRLGQLRLVLRAVHGGVGGGVDDEVGRGRFHRRRDAGAVGQVELGRLQRGDLVALRQQPGEQGPRDLALAAGDENAHQKTLPRSLRRGWRRSLSESVAASGATPQAMSRSGSSQARPRSQSGA